MLAHPPSKLPLPIRGCGPIPNTWSLSQISQPSNSISIHSAVCTAHSCARHTDADRSTHRPCYVQHLYQQSTSMHNVEVMRPNKKTNTMTRYVQPVSRLFCEKLKTHCLKKTNSLYIHHKSLVNMGVPV